MRISELTEFLCEKYGVSVDKINYLPAGVIDYKHGKGEIFHLSDVWHLGNTRVNAAKCPKAGKVYVSLGEPHPGLKLKSKKPCR